MEENNNNKYMLEQIKRATNKHDFIRNIKIKFFGDVGESNYLDITHEQLRHIKIILGGDDDK